MWYLQTATPTAGTGPAELVDYWPTVVRAGWFLAGFAVASLVGWYLVVPVVTRTVRRRNRNNPTIQEAVARYLRLFVLAIAVFVGAGVAGYGRFLTSSALVVAAATLALGVAGQSVIGSLIGGLVLVFDPEFNVGNHIEWETGEGVIRSITLRVTRVETPNGELVTVPNTVLTSQAIRRPYGGQRYRVVEQVGLSYADDLDEAVRHLESVAAELDAVLAAPPPRALVSDLGGDEVVVDVHYWVADPQEGEVRAVRSSYVRAAKARLESEGITISPASQRELQGRLEVDRRTEP